MGEGGLEKMQKVSIWVEVSSNNQETTCLPGFHHQNKCNSQIPFSLVQNAETERGKIKWLPSWNGMTVFLSKKVEHFHIITVSMSCKQKKVVSYTKI